METVSQPVERDQSHLNSGLEKTPAGKGSLKIHVPETHDIQFATPQPTEDVSAKKFQTPDTAESARENELKQMSAEADRAEQALLLAEAKQKEIEMHPAELIALTKEAEALEAQSKALFEEAENERASVKRALEQVLKAEEVEHEKFLVAEKIEKERREAAREALPQIQSAEEAKAFAEDLGHQAEDHEFHAQILRNRATSLLQESEQMKSIAEKKKVEIEAKYAEIAASLDELEELEGRADDGKPGDLPEYILECEKEIGMLQKRMGDLREEIQWAQREIEKRKDDGKLWNRLLTKRRTLLAQLKAQNVALQEELEEAEDRAVIAIAEAKLPAQMAEQKFAHAAALRQEASLASEKCLELERKAFEAARKAAEIQKKRESVLLEAAAAEKEAKILEKEAVTLEDRSNEHIAEANRIQIQAAELKRQANEDIAIRMQEIRGISQLDQLHPMNLTKTDLLECPF